MEQLKDTERTRILIIEDDTRLLEATRLVLEEEGFEVTTATDGSYAVSAFRQRPAAIVLCDMFMPGQEGIETIQQLRREFPSVKIIAMSGGGIAGRGDVLAAAKHLGASSVLYKPFSKAELVAAIHKLLAEQ